MKKNRDLVIIPIMSFAKFSSDLKTGIETIDNQHKKLIGILNDIYDLMLEMSDLDAFNKHVSELEKYTVEHFLFEEELMKKNQYPFFDFHKTEHLGFIEKISEFSRKLKNGKKSVSAEMLVYLKNWLFHHIMESDQRYKSYIK